MRITERDLYRSGLPACWAAAYGVLGPAPALRQAVRHTVGTLNRMPAGYRWATAVALRLFPAAFRAVTRTGPHAAPPGTARRGLARLRGLPGYAELLRALTALALYGALDSGPLRTGLTRTGEAVT